MSPTALSLDSICTVYPDGIVCLLVKMSDRVTRGAWVAWAACVLAACQGPAPAVQPAAPLRAEWEAVAPAPPEAAAVIRARWLAHHSLRDSRSTVVYLNFGGGTIYRGADSNALTNTSWWAPDTVDYPAFDGTPFDLHLPYGTSLIAEDLWTVFGGFNVEFVTERPPSGNYMMVMIGGSASVLGQPDGTLGVAPLDCQGGLDDLVLNPNPLDIVFIFSDDIARFGLGLPGLAYVIAHESAHTFGLAHIDRPWDIMTPFIDDQYGRSWGAGSIPAGDMTCSTSGSQDDHDYLSQAVGYGYPRKPLPQVSLTSPADGTVVGKAWDATVTASADLFIVSVEIWVNGRYWDSTDTPPYTFSFHDLPPGIYSLRARALDPYNAAESGVVNVFVPEPPRPGCLADGDCGDVRRCENGVCVSPPPSPQFGVLGAPCGTDADCLSGRCLQAAVSYCSRACREDVGAFCPFGYACEADGYCASLTRVPPGGPGTPCHADWQCQGDVCSGAGRNDGYCSQPCAPGSDDCPLGARCVARDAGPGHTCGRPGSAGGCTAGPAPSSAWPAAALLAIWLLLACWRRR